MGFVIESCQGWLKNARNPAAVVMIAIRNVAARVGRRYWGNREAADLQSLLAAAGMGNTAAKPEAPLQVFVGSPVPSPEAETDPYQVAVCESGCTELDEPDCVEPAKKRMRANIGEQFEGSAVADETEVDNAETSIVEDTE